MPTKMITLDDKFTLAMTAPDPKKFSSDVEIIHKSGEKEKVTLEVNAPHSFGIWSVYQLSYDDSKGK